MLHYASMSCTVSTLTFERLAVTWPELRSGLNWSSIFVLPPWLQAWWQNFREGADLLLLDVREDDRPIGIAPLSIRDGTATFIGSADICDYLDFVVEPGKEQAFFTAVLDELERGGIHDLHLDSLRHDSTVITSLVELAKGRGCDASCHVTDVSLYLELPPTWEAFLDMLNAKQRREVRRKLRRLSEAGDIIFRTVDDAASLQPVMDIFLKQLRVSREEKAAFMSDRMETFFRSIAEAMAGAEMLRFGILELDETPVAVVMCFDYNDIVYLYNSGYDIRYSDLSVGILSKVLSIRDSIERGRKRYDFLKGAEEYKYRLGGTEIAISGCHIILK